MKTHGMTGTPEYKAYLNAKSRCNGRSPKWKKDYVDRGIEFAFPNFEAFYKELGNRPSPLYTVERIDNDKGYTQGNVKWATRKEQSHNTRLTAKAQGCYQNVALPLKPWRARIRVGGKHHCLGYFPTKKAAHAAYLTARKELV